MKNNALIVAAGLVGGGLVSLAGYRLGTATADVPAPSNRLVYSGQLLSGGTPMLGEHSVRIEFFGVPTGGTSLCSLPTQNAIASTGQFSVPASSCNAVLEESSTIYVQLTVDPGKPTAVQIPADGVARPMLGAAPYAVQAASAASLSEPLSASLVISADSSTVQNRLDALQIAVDNAIPVGTVIISAATNCPPGFLAADGTSVFRTGASGFPALFAAIGTAHGASDATHFNLPDYRGRFLRGVATTDLQDPDFASRTEMNPGGSTSGVGSVQEDQFESHNHHLGWGPFPLPFQSGPLRHVNHVYPGPSDELFTGGRGGTETRPRNAAVLFCIKH